MSPRRRSIGLCAFLCLFVLSADLALAQSQWKEIPVGYNMPKSVMAAASPSVMAAAMAAPPKAASRPSFAGVGRDRNRPWEIEFHGGGFFSTDSGSGNTFALPTGTPFRTVNGTPSLFVSSYMFGDGANLANQVIAAGAFGGNIVPLDPLLRRALGTRSNGPSIGARLSRDFGAYFNGELNFDWSFSPVEIRDSRLLQIEATRASFGTFFPISTPEGAISDIRRSVGQQLFYTGVINVNLKTTGKVLPYLSFGAGAVTDVGPLPHAGIFGQYTFNGAGPHQETDIVNLEAGSMRRTHFVGVLGFGMKYFATPSWGLRLDVRDHVTRDYIDTILSAHPIVATLGPSDVVSFGTTPDLQFSNDPSAGASSLGGSVNRVRTFKGDGINNQINLSIGVFHRF